MSWYDEITGRLKSYGFTGELVERMTNLRQELRDMDIMGLHEREDEFLWILDTACKAAFVDGLGKGKKADL